MRHTKPAILLVFALALGGSAALAEGPVLDIQEVGLSPTGAHDLSWGIDPANPGYLVYDAVLGDLPTLLASGGDYTMFILGCIAEDAAAPPVALPVPPIGSRFFFLVKAQDTPASCGVGSWNEAFAVAPLSQVGDRDPEMPLDPGTCPCP